MAIAVLKQILHWDKKTRDEKNAYYAIFGISKYRFFYGLSYVICLFPIPLRYILRLCLSDKEAPGGHHYGATYGRVFRKFKYRPIKLLEIGIGGYDWRPGGDSLNAWQSFFPFGKIVGCDIEDKTRLATLGTTIYRIDQSSAGDLKTLRDCEKAFEIIIDDGSHLNEHQIFTFENLWPSLKDGGVYVVEDIQTSYWKQGSWDGADVESPEFSKTCVGYFLNLTKYINHTEFPDLDGVDQKALEFAKSIKQVIFEHNLIIVLKGSNATTSNILRRENVCADDEA